MQKAVLVVCVLMAAQQGCCQDNTESQELLGTVECVVTDLGIQLCNQKIRAGESPKGPFIKYIRVPREGGIGKISTYSYFGEGVKPILM